MIRKNQTTSIFGVYHFYNAVGNSGRVIALATSKDLSK
jgi:hypothetical protein